MARRRVQYGVVDASDADVGAGAPGFRATWQSKALLKLSVDTAANLFSAQKKIASAFYRFRLIIVPNSLSDYILHILDPSLSSEMINNTILNASGAAVEFADIDGTALQFVTETSPDRLKHPPDRDSTRFCQPTQPIICANSANHVQIIMTSRMSTT
ncbi:MAG: hypothetical protein FRX49_09157 [Trebouxia sp. A1-2]|nr:MAG: hypothetical protein FRX49_09157 [Trebouxia sp. A1-2]